MNLIHEAMGMKKYFQRLKKWFKGFYEKYNLFNLGERLFGWSFSLVMFPFIFVHSFSSFSLFLLTGNSFFAYLVKLFILILVVVWAMGKTNHIPWWNDFCKNHNLWERRENLVEMLSIILFLFLCAYSVWHLLVYLYEGVGVFAYFVKFSFFVMIVGWILMKLG